MIEYIKAQSKTNDAIIGSSFTTDELHRFSKSDYRWADNKGNTYQTRKFRKGEIYQFEFGKNYSPEMSYEHRGLIIGVKNKLLHVLPIFSYDPRKHTDVYHPIDYPSSKSDLFLLKSSEFSCIKHDSVLKLNDLRTISVNRALYKHNGNIATTTDVYKAIEALVLKKYFAEFYIEFEENKKCIQDLEQRNKELENQLSLLKQNAANMKKINSDDISTKEAAITKIE